MPNERYLRDKWDSVPYYGNESTRLRILTAIIKKIGRKKQFHIFLKITGTIAAASVLLISGVIIERLAKSPSLENEQTMWIIADNGAQLLPDSTKVWMEHNSRLRFSNSFIQDRELWLDGNASFDVTHKNNNEDFRIITSAGTIRVRGTCFSVRQDDIDKISITLYEGDLDFISKNRRLVVNLDPNDHLEFNYKNQNYKVTPFFKNIAWTDGKFKLENADLKQIISFIQWKYHTAVILEAGVRDNVQKMSGIISYNEPIESVIDKLCYSLKLEYKKENKAYRLFINN